MRRPILMPPIFIIVSVMTRKNLLRRCYYCPVRSRITPQFIIVWGSITRLSANQKKPKTILIFTINLKKNNSAIN